MKLRYLALSLLVAACGSNEAPASRSSSNQLDGKLVQMNESAIDAQRTATALAELVLGTNGIADRAKAIRTMPVATVAEIAAWRAERDELRRQLQEATDDAARFALQAYAVETNRRAFIEEQALGFPWGEVLTASTTSSEIASTRQPLVLEVMAVATLGIGAYRFLKGFGELADNTQRMVYSTANGDDSSRGAVIAILRGKGVEIPESATAEEVIEAFDDQPRDLRRTITSEVEQWNESKFDDPDPAVSDAVEGRVQEARDDVPEIANEAGAFGTTQTVSLVQAVTGGVGSVVGGVPGATADLVLTATEMNPTDIVQRNVTVYVAAGEKVTPPTETTPMLPAEAVQTIERAEAGDPTVNPEELKEAASALIKEVTDELRLRFGPGVQLAQRIALSTGSLSGTTQADGTVEHAVTLSLPGFQNGESAEVVVVREGHLPHEVATHVLGPTNALVLDSPPLLGTISVESSPGAVDPSGSQLYSVTGHVVRVPAGTELLCQGVNAICSPSSAPVFGDSSVTFNVQVFGSAQLRLVRHDTGESYSLSLKAQGAPPDANDAPGNLDPALIGTWTFYDGDDEFSWVFHADGTCVQSTPAGDYDWEWTIENGQLKLFVGGGTPAYMQYMIEGSQLYFWADTLETWALPFTKA